MTTIREALISNDTVSMLLENDRPDKYIEQITKKRKAVVDAEMKLESFKINGIRTIRDLMIGIEGEWAVIISGDKEFKNAEQRKAALSTTLQADARYIGVKADLQTAETRQIEIIQSIGYAKAELEAARHAFSAWQTMIDLVAGLSRESVEHRIVATGAEIKLTGGQ